MTERDEAKDFDEIKTALRLPIYSEQMGELPTQGIGEAAVTILANRILPLLSQARDKALQESIEAIGPNQASKEIREYRCPNYGDYCYESADYYAVKSGGTKYCSQHGKKMVLFEGREPEGEDWTRNEMRAEIREALEALRSKNQ